MGFTRKEIDERIALAWAAEDGEIASMLEFLRDEVVRLIAEHADCNRERERWKKRAGVAEAEARRAAYSVD